MKRVLTCGECKRHHDKSCLSFTNYRSICEEFEPMCQSCSHRYWKTCRLRNIKVDKYKDSCENHEYDSQKAP